MNRIIPLHTVGILLLLATASVGVAVAADLPLPTKAPPAPVLSWTGWYVGLNAGATINNSSYSLDPAGCFITTACGTGGLAGNPFRAYAANLNGAAFIGGGQIGYNWQVAPVWVVGLEADLNYTGINQSDTVTQALGPPIFAPGAFVHTVTDRLDWFGTVRPRVGFLVTPTLLLYGTGGLAYGHVSSSEFALFPPPGSSDTYAGSLSAVRAGWTAGAGLEYAIKPGWMLKAEYLHVDLGSTTYPGPCASPPGICAIVPPPAYQTTVTSRENIVRLGFDYKFNWGGLIPTRN